MSERFIDKATYLRLVEAFRTHGTNWRRVSIEADVSRNTAKRAYNAGWLDRWEWARPIASVLADGSEEVRAALTATVQAELEAERRARPKARNKVVERRAAERQAALADAEARRQADTVAEVQRAESEADKLRRRIAEQALREREEAARARAAKEAAEEAEREKARQQALEARTQEAQLVRLARGAAIGTLGGTMRLMPGLAKLADQLRAAIDAGQIPIDKAASTIGQISRTVKDATLAAQVVIELERLHVGAPQAIIGVVQHEISVDEAVSAVQEAEAAVQRARQLGLVVEQQNALGGRTKVAEA
jgi:fused signal recognition particle receptor